MPYLFHIAILVCIYSIIAVSLDLLVGHLGTFSVAQAAFVGIGAYVSAILTVERGLSFGVGVLVGMGAAATISLVLSIPSLRISDDYFAIVTFGFGVILSNIFNNWMEVTRGPMGIPGIPPPKIMGWAIHSSWQFFIVSAVFAALAYITIRLISTSPFGRVLHAIREDAVFAESLGKNTLRFKTISFGVSAASAAAAGSLYAHYVTYVDPTSFTVMESILIISMVIVGGAGSSWGPFIGAAVLIILPEALRFVGLPSSLAANLRQMLYGGLLVIMMVFRPRGLVGQYRLNR